MAKVELIDIKSFSDKRGSLIALEQNNGLPFDVKRVYYIFDVVDPSIRRGFHAHINLKQLLVAISGSCTVECKYRKNTETFVLDSPKKGLLIEGLVWREMFNFSEGCVLLVLASEYYDESDYIRSYDEFIELNSKDN